MPSPNKPRFLIAFFVLLSIIEFSCTGRSENHKTSFSSKVNLIDSLLNSAVISQEIPGAVACIVLDGKVVYKKAFGWRNIEKKIAMEEDDIFRMASMTKGLTAVAVLQLCERGLLSLDDNISMYIPEFKNPQVLVTIQPDSDFVSRPAKSEITIRQLLTHTSGLGYGFQDEKYNALILKNRISEGFEDDSRTSLENIQLLAQIPLLCEPGEKYIYSLSYDVLGVIIEKISELRFDKYITRNILSPLGMKDSYFLIPLEKQPRLVSIYQPKAGSKGLETTSYPDTAYPKIMTRQYFSGGADLCSTAEDFSRFVQMVLNKGSLNNERILGKRYIEMMLSKQTRFEGGSSDQGFAAWVTNETGAAEGPMSKGSFGFGGFWDTYSWADPEKNFVAVLLLQMYPGNQANIHQKFQQIVYRAIDER
jgi:CubicO group peptidase (beta-lactamase class C family)